MTYLYATLTVLVAFLAIIGIRVLGSKKLGGIVWLKGVFSSGTSTLSVVVTILLIVAAMVVSIWGLYIHAEWSNPHPATIGSWGRGHWFSLLLLWGIVAALIWLNAEKATAKTLQWVLAGVVATTLVVFPLWGWATSPAAPAHAIAATRATEWHQLNLAAGEESEGIEVPVGTRLAFDGDEGIVLRTVYADGSMCITPREACPKKPIANSFLVNEATTSGKVVYTFK